MRKSIGYGPFAVALIANARGINKDEYNEAAHVLRLRYQIPLRFSPGRTLISNSQNLPPLAQHFVSTTSTGRLSAPWYWPAAVPASYMQIFWPILGKP